MVNAYNWKVQSPEALAEGVCHTREECIEMYRTLDPMLKQGAVDLLAEKLSNYKQELLDAVEEDPENWSAGSHFFWGMQIRNMLRASGFGEKELGVHNLDDVYVALIEEAIGVTQETRRR